MSAFEGLWIVTPYVQPNGVIWTRTTDRDGGHPVDECFVRWPDEKYEEIRENALALSRALVGKWAAAA